MLPAQNLEKQERMKSSMMFIIRAYFLFWCDIIQSWSFASSKVTPTSVPIRPPAKEQIRHSATQLVVEARVPIPQTCSVPACWKHFEGMGGGLISFT